MCEGVTYHEVVPYGPVTFWLMMSSSASILTSLMIKLKKIFNSFRYLFMIIIIIINFMLYMEILEFIWCTLMQEL